MKSYHRRTRKLIVVVLSTTALALGVTGIANSAGADDQTAAQAVASAQAFVAKYLGTTASVQVPKKGFNPGHHKLLIIAPSLTSASYAQNVKYTSDAAKAMGWTVEPVCSSFGSPTTGTQCMDQGIQEHVSAIIYIGAPVTSITAPIEQVQNAGIVFGTQIAGYNTTPNPEYFSTSTLPGSKVVGSAENMPVIAQALAAEAIIQAGGQGKIAIFQDPTFGELLADDEGAYIGQNCQPCTTTRITSTLADLIGNPVPPAWTAFMSSNPVGSVGAVIAPYDAYASVFAKAETNAGRADIPILGAGPLSSTTDPLIASGTSPDIASVAVPEEYQYWALVDDVARAVVHAPVWHITIPLNLAVKTNVSGDSGGLGYDMNVSNDFVAQFKKDWSTRSTPRIVASRITGVAAPGRRVVMRVLGSNFFGTPKITSNAVGTTVRVVKISSSVLTLLVTTRAGTGKGVHLLTIRFANGQVKKLRYNVS